MHAIVSVTCVKFTCTGIFLNSKLILLEYPDRTLFSNHLSSTPSSSCTKTDITPRTLCFWPYRLSVWCCRFWSRGFRLILLVLKQGHAVWRTSSQVFNSWAAWIFYYDFLLQSLPWLNAWLCFCVFYRKLICCLRWL